DDALDGMGRAQVEASRARRISRHDNSRVGSPRSGVTKMMQEIEERRSAILNCWQNFLMRPTTVLVAEVIERSEAMLPDWFAPWAPGIVVASDYLLRAAGYHPGARRPGGWIKERPDLFTKVKYGNELITRKCSEFWTVQRKNVQMLAFPF